MEYAEKETEAVYSRLQGESRQGDAQGRKDHGTVGSRIRSA